MWIFSRNPSRRPLLVLFFYLLIAKNAKSQFCHKRGKSDHILTMTLKLPNGLMPAWQFLSAHAILSCFQGTSKIRPMKSCSVSDRLLFSRENSNRATTNRRRYANLCEWRHQKRDFLGPDSETCFEEAMNRAREASLILYLSLSVRVHLMTSGTQLTPHLLNLPSPIDRETSNTPRTRPSLFTTQNSKINKQLI